MIKVRSFAPLLALGALTALPACSMFGGDSGSSSRSSQYSQSSYAAAPSTYNTPTSMTGDSGTMAPVSPDMVRQVQAKLQQDGSYRGKVDGVWGPMTERAVRSWQQGHNLSTSGEIDMATLQSMNISANGSQYGQNNNGGSTTQPTGSNPNYSTSGNYGTRSNYSGNTATQPNGIPPSTNPNAPNTNTSTTNNGTTSNTNNR